MLTSALLAALLLAPCLGRAEPVPAAYRAGILLRSLGYERRIGETKGDLIVAVVSTAEPASQRDGQLMGDAFSSLAKRMRVLGRAIVVRRVRASEPRALAERLAGLAPSAVYFALGAESFASSLPGGAQLVAWVPMCADGDRMLEGCVLGVRQLEERSQLVVNLRLAHALKLDFDPRMLRLSNVIK